METWFLVDVGLNFRFGYLDEQTMNIEMNLAAIKRRYLRGWFVLDAVSSVPLTILSLVFPSLIHGKIITTFRFFKLFRMLKLVRFKALREIERSKPALVRLVKLLLALAYFLHFVACAYWGVVRAECPSGTGYYEDHFCPRDPTSLDKGTAGNQLIVKYMEAFYWAVLIILGNGSTEMGTQATTSGEYAFYASMLLLVRLPFVAYMVDGSGSPCHFAGFWHFLHVAR